MHLKYSSRIFLLDDKTKGEFIMANAFQKAIKKSAAPAPKPKSKASVAYLAVSKAVSDAVDKFQAAKKAKKEAEAEMSFNESIVIDAVRPVQDKDGFNNNYKKSYSIKGNTNDAKYVTQNRASIASEDADEIKNMLGSDYEFLIEEKVTVTLKAEIFADEERQEELMKLLGEKFNEFFDVTTKLAVADDYDKNVYAVVNDQDKLDKVRTFVKPYKAALR